MDPMAETEEPLIQICPQCGTQIDISEQEPLTRVTCPTCGELTMAAATIDHFELLEILGRGGMGVVYKARDTSLDRPVALKLLRKTEGVASEQIAQLATEASITASINHPHVVKVFTTGTDHGRFYIAMELVDKGTLDSLIELQGQVPETQVLQVGIQIASGLRAAQQVGLIHRDVKPGNILFADAQTAKIVDFGLAIFMEDEASVRGEVWGTPYYVAPEKLDHKPEDFRSDIYSLGGTLFHALAGRPPFEAEDASMVALKHLKSQAVSLQAFAPQVSGSTAYVINRTLNKDPEQRYQSYDELIEHLEYARAEIETNAANPQRTKRVVLETDADKKAMGWLAIGAIGAILAMAITVFVFRDSLFKSDETPAKGGASPANTTAAKAAAMFPEAREKLVQGKAADAAEAFRQAASQPKLAPAQLNWANLLEGLSELAAGRRTEANAAFQKIEERGPFSKKSEDEKLATFFTATARTMIGEAPIERAAAGDFSKTNYEAIAPLVFAMKDWELGMTEDAVALLGQFRQTMPAGADAWIAELKPLAANYIEESLAFQMASDKLKAAKSTGEIKSAINDLKNVKGKLAGRAKELVGKASGSLAEKEKQRTQALAQGRLPDGVYKVVNRKTGKGLDVAGHSLSDGGKIHQWSYSGGLNQQWRLTSLGGAVFQITSVESGKALNVPKTPVDGDVPLQQWTASKSPAQRWKIEKTNGEFFKITAETSGKALAPAGGSGENSAAIVQTPFTGAPEQQWKFEAP